MFNLIAVIVLTVILTYLFAMWDINHQLTWSGRLDYWRCLWLVDIFHITSHVRWEHTSVEGKDSFCKYCKYPMPHISTDAPTTVDVEPSKLRLVK